MRGTRATPAGGRCQVYDAVKIIVVGNRVRPHLPRAEQVPGTPRGSTLPARCQVYDAVKTIVVGNRVRPHLPRTEPVPGTPRGSTLPARCQVYDAVKIIVVGNRVRPHLPRADRVPGTPRGSTLPARCQVYDAVKIIVVGNRVRPHLPGGAGANRGSAPGPRHLAGADRSRLGSRLRSVWPAGPCSHWRSRTTRGQQAPRPKRRPTAPCAGGSKGQAGLEPQMAQL